MKRSQGKTIQMTSADHRDAKSGVKTCTSRYGDRTAEYQIGQIYDLKDNDTDEILPILVTATEVKKLKEVTSDEAKAIGNYSWAEHVADFFGVYGVKLGREVNENTVLTLIHFRLLSLEEPI